MKNEFYSNRNLNYREKRNRIGRAFLFLGLIISTVLTIVVTFFMIINNLGISPSDQHGFKGVRYDVGKEIVNNFKNNGQPNEINDTKFSLKYKNEIVYSVSFYETEEKVEFTKVDRGLTYTIIGDKKTQTFEETGNNEILIKEIETFNQAIGYITSETNIYLSLYNSYEAPTYKEIVNNPNLRYFYNEEKKQLKFAAPSNDFIIVDDKGAVLKGTINLGTEEEPMIHQIMREKAILEENA